MKEQYKPRFLNWTKSYNEEVSKLRELIEGNPSDINQLKQEYYLMTGKRYKRRKRI